MHSEKYPRIIEFTNLDKPLIVLPYEKGINFDIIYKIMMKANILRLPTVYGCGCRYKYIIDLFMSRLGISQWYLDKGKLICKSDPTQWYFNVEKQRSRNMFSNKSYTFRTIGKRNKLLYDKCKEKEENNHKRISVKQSGLNGNKKILKTNYIEHTYVITTIIIFSVFLIVLALLWLWTLIRTIYKIANERKRVFELSKNNYSLLE